MIINLKQQAKFYIIVLLVLILFMFITFSYSYEINRIIVPLLVLLLGSVSCILKLIIIYLPKYANILDTSGMLERSKEAGNSRKPGDKQVEKGGQIKKEVSLFVWLFSSVVLMYLLGFVITCAVSTFAFVSFVNKKNKLYGLMLSVCVTVSLLVLSKFLKVPLDYGILF